MYTFSSESVSDGHPDKLADQIADAILDACLAGDAASRVACEVLVSRDLVVLAGEITTQAHLDYESIVRRVIREVGYTEKGRGFDAESCRIVQNLSRQSEDIARGVNKSAQKRQGAGDQGMVFGYACQETPQFMPLPIMLAHKIMRELVARRKEGELPFLRPDAKTQVSILFDEKGTPLHVDRVILSVQHSAEISQRELSKVMRDFLSRILPSKYYSSQTAVDINPAGRFVLGGPACDAGLTGRKIVVDTYGGQSRHGGGSFSGKDPSKIDRSAAYMARYIAKQVVAAQLASRCEIQLAYAIGQPEPVSLYLDTFGTHIFPPKKIQVAIENSFDLTPEGMTDQLHLQNQNYFLTAFGGHFGRSSTECSWERMDRIEELTSHVHHLSAL